MFTVLKLSSFRTRPRVCCSRATIHSTSWVNGHCPKILICQLYWKTIGQSRFTLGSAATEHQSTVPAESMTSALKIQSTVPADSMTITLKSLDLPEVSLGKTNAHVRFIPGPAAAEHQCTLPAESMTTEPLKSLSANSVTGEDDCSLRIHSWLCCSYGVFGFEFFWRSNHWASVPCS